MWYSGHMIRVQLSAYNRLLTGYNSTGLHDPTTTIFTMEISKLWLYVLILYAKKRGFLRYAANADTGEYYYHVGGQTMVSVTDKTNPNALDPVMLQKLNRIARKISLRKLLTIVKPSPIMVTH